MADKKKSGGEDMSVDELVSLLRSNIDSEEEIENDSDISEAKTIAKKSDPDNDIAAMLKKFMPDENSEGVDFELDESSDAMPEEEDFELENDGDFLFENGSEEVEQDDYVLEIDEAAGETFDAVDYEEEGDGVDLDEPAIFEENGFTLDEGVDMEDFFDGDEILEEEPKKKTFGSLFGFGKKKNKGLADGYAKMLEMQYDEETQSEAEAVEESAFTEFGEQIDMFDDAFENVEDSSEDGGQTEKIEDANEEISDYDAFINEADMPSIEDTGASESLEDLSEKADEAETEVLNDVDEQGQLFVLDAKEEISEPEDDYFVTEKNPLAFDDEDETPIRPDAEAFADVPSSDATPDDMIGEEISAAENLDGDTEPEGLDDKDINLMIALGYEDELEKAIGKKTVDEFSDQLSAEIVDFIDIDKSYAFDGFELHSPEKFRSVGNKYKNENHMMKMRLIGTTAVAFALLIFELLGAFGVTLGGALNIHHYPVVGIMLSLQLLVIAASLSFKQLFDGLLDAVTFNPSPESVPAVAVVMTVIYDVIMALIAPNTGLHLYNFPAALCLVFMVLNEYFDLSREIRAFHTIATRRPKYAMTASNAEERTAEEEMADAFAEDTQNSSVANAFEVKKVSFIDNYFRRTNIRSLKNKKTNLLIYPFIALAIALGILSYVTNKSGVTAFNISILTVLFCMPMSSLFIYSFPFYSAVKNAFGYDATIIGEESIDEYSGAGTVTFAEKDVFPSFTTVTKGIKLYDNNAIYYVLYHLASLYSKIGGPLKERLLQATAEMGHSEDVEIVSVSQKGIEAIIDGKVRVLAGQASYMAECGIFVGNDPDDAQMLVDGTTALYLVLDGVLSAKLYVNYEIDPEFENVIEILASEGMEAVIRTSDPNIDEELLASKLRVSRFPARIVKCHPEANADLSNAESGIVSRSSLAALSYAMALCNKILRVRKTCRTVGVMSMIVGVIMMAFLAFFSSKLSVPSVYVALYQLFWMIPMFLFTKLYVK